MYSLVDKKSLTLEEYNEIFSFTQYEPDGIAQKATMVNRTKRKLRKFFERAALEYIRETEGKDYEDYEEYNVYFELVNDVKIDGSVIVKVHSSGRGMGKRNVPYIHETYNIDKRSLIK